MSTPIPRCSARQVRTVSIDTLFAAGFPLAQAIPNTLCPACGDRIGDHVAVLPHLPDEILTDRLEDRSKGRDRRELQPARVAIRMRNPGLHPDQIANRSPGRTCGRGYDLRGDIRHLQTSPSSISA